jgi:hypothetical protein
MGAIFAAPSFAALETSSIPVTGALDGCPGLVLSHGTCTRRFAVHLRLSSLLLGEITEWIVTNRRSLNTEQLPLLLPEEPS